MKKIYMKPNTDIVKLQLERVIATSTLNIITDVKAQSVDDYGVSMNDKEDFEDFDESLW